jgi:hypothetical protein
VRQSILDVSFFIPPLRRESYNIHPIVVTSESHLAALLLVKERRQLLLDWERWAAERQTAHPPEICPHERWAAERKTAHVASNQIANPLFAMGP